MSDLISRQDAIDAMYRLEMEDIETYGCSIPEGFDAKPAVEALEALPSVESVRTAKVIMHKYWLGVSLNVVGEQTIGYEWICENCKKMVLDSDDYCSHCGCRLDWNEDIPMEYFESGGR